MQIIKTQDKLPDLKAITLDCVGAKDLDDAFLIKKLANGNWCVQFSLVNAGSIVNEDCQADRKARKQAKTSYEVNEFNKRSRKALFKTEFLRKYLSYKIGAARPSMTIELEYTPSGGLLEDKTKIFESNVDVVRCYDSREFSKLLKSRQDKTINEWGDFIKARKLLTSISLQEQADRACGYTEQPASSELFAIKAKINNEVDCDPIKIIGILKADVEGQVLKAFEQNNIPVAITDKDVFSLITLPYNQTLKGKLVNVFNAEVKRLPFTTPIRRYFDLHNMRNLTKFMRGLPTKPLTNDEYDALKRREKRAKNERVKFGKAKKKDPKGLYRVIFQENDFYAYSPKDSNGKVIGVGLTEEMARERYAALSSPKPAKTRVRQRAGDLQHAKVA